MRPLRFAVLSVAMMGAGAGLLAAAERARAAGAASAPEAGESGPASTARELPRSVLVVGDPRGAGADQKLVALSERMASIEGKLDTLAAHPGAAPEPSDETLTKPPENRTPDEQQSMDAASSIIDAAVKNGAWVEGDQARIREVTAQILPADRFALRMKLTMAANAGRLKDLAPQPFFF
jgi:hypothetical protein